MRNNKMLFGFLTFILFVMSVIDTAVFVRMGIYADEYGTSPTTVLGSEFLLYMNWILLFLIYGMFFLVFLLFLKEVFGNKYNK